MVQSFSWLSMVSPVSWACSWQGAVSSQRPCSVKVAAKFCKQQSVVSCFWHLIVIFVPILHIYLSTHIKINSCFITMDSKTQMWCYTYLILSLGARGRWITVITSPSWSTQQALGQTYLYDEMPSILANCKLSNIYSHNWHTWVDEPGKVSEASPKYLFHYLCMLTRMKPIISHMVNTCSTT